MNQFPAPAVGDIVWCRFPEIESLKPGPKPRPGLVLEVDDRCSPLRVRVAYGTSKATPIAKGDFVIGPKNVAAFKAAGISVATRFQLRQVVVLPYNSSYFDFAPRGNGLLAATPVLGTLHASMMGELKRAALEAGLIK